MKHLICEKCGKPVDEGTVFCPDCGAAIFHTVPVTPPAPPPPKPTPAQPPAEELPKKFDYKKLIPPIATVLAVVLALILGWNTLSGILAPGNDPQLSTQPSTEQTTPSTISPSETYAYNPDAKPTGTTAPTETYAYDPDAKPTQPPETEPTPTETEPAPTSPDLSWVVTTSQKMSYEEFFSEDRPLYGKSDNTSWVADDGNTYTINELLQVFRDGELIYTVPCAGQNTEERKLLTTDGTYVYIADEYNLYQIELLTGNIKDCISLAKPFEAFAKGPDLIYLAASSPDDILICRYYVPSQTLDILHKIAAASTPETWFTLSLGSPYSSLGDITWTMINPEMHFFLSKELNNPASKYRNWDYPDNLDFSQYWKDPRLLNNLPYNSKGMVFLQTIQEDTGIYALLKGTYHCADGTYTERTGVVDDCWFGSDYGCDHFAPEETADVDPTALHGSPVSITGMEPPSEQIAQDMLQEQWAEGNSLFETPEVMYAHTYVYVRNGSEALKSSDIPVKYNWHKLYLTTKHYAFYISTEETVVQVDTSGKATTLYSAQHGPLSSLEYRYGKLCFLDGDTVILLDLIECSYREVARHPGVHYVSFELEGELHVTTILGLQVDAFTYDPKTDTVADSHPYL